MTASTVSTHRPCVPLSLHQDKINGCNYSTDEIMTWVKNYIVIKLRWDKVRGEEGEIYYSLSYTF